MAGRRDIERLKRRVGTFDAPIGAVQEPERGVVYDRHGNPKPLLSGQDEHAVPARAKRERAAEPELHFATDLFAQDPGERAVLAACHKVLARRVVTEHQLAEKLRAASFEDAQIDFALERCREAGLVDDDAYARAWVESRIGRGHGARRIEQDLRRKGIDRERIAATMHELAGPDVLEDAALEAARGRARRLDLEDPADRARLQRWLAGRGYAAGQVFDAVRTVRQEHAARRG